MTAADVRRTADRLGRRQAQILRALHLREGCQPPRQFCVRDLPDLLPGRVPGALSLRKTCKRLVAGGLLEPFRGDLALLTVTDAGRAVAYRLQDRERAAKP